MHGHVTTPHFYTSTRINVLSIQETGLAFILARPLGIDLAIKLDRADLLRSVSLVPATRCLDMTATSSLYPFR